MSEKSKKEVIAELEAVNELLDEAVEIMYYLDKGFDAEINQNAAAIKQKLGSLEIPDVFSKMPIFPKNEDFYSATEKDKNSKQKVFRIALIVTVAAVALFLITNASFFYTLSLVGIFATAGTFYFYNKINKEYKKKKAEYDKSVSTYNRTYKAFSQAVEVFESEKAAYIETAKEYSKKYIKAHDSIDESFLESFQKSEKMRERLDEVEQELDTHETIIPEHYKYLPQIIASLKSGRADSYKEALNLAIAEEREEAERQERMAQEAARTRALEMQVEEERRHNQQMERQQREHEQAMLSEQKRQNDAIMRQQREQAFEARRQAEKAASEARNQASQQRAAGVSKCASCANSKHCPSHIKNNGSGLTCGGYVPYGGRR